MPKKKAKQDKTMSIGQRIKEARESAGMTQVELAEILKVTQGAIHQYELSGDEMQIGTLKKIARALRTTLEKLFGE